MSFNTLACGTAIINVLTGLGSLAQVQFGAPDSVGVRVSAFVTMGGQTIGPKTTGTTKREARYFVELAYRLDGTETTAETVMMGIVDAFIAAIFADLTLAGTCQYTEISLALADAPEYRTLVGKEYREYPIVLTCCQYGTYNTNP